MAAHKRVFAPERIAEAKRLYENSGTPAGDIAAMLGICRSTLTHRANEWKWNKRAHAGTAVDLVRMVRGAVAAQLTDTPAAGAAGAHAVSPEQRAALAQRIQAVVEREMAVVEQIVAIIGPSDKSEAEQSVRMLAGISRTLREIAALNQPDNEMAPDGSDDDDDDFPRDIDQFRREIARRLQGLVDTEQRREGEGACEGTGE